MAPKGGGSRTLTIDITTADAQTLAALKRVQKQLGQTGDEAEKAGKKARKGFDLKDVVAGAAVGAGIVKLTQSASDLGRATQANTAIFGAQAGAMQTWAASADQSLGLSEQAALDAAGSFGDMFTRLDVGQGQAAGMSQELVKLGVQFGALKGADPTSVLEAMSSAFRGEYDALQRYIPSITDAAIKQRAMADSGVDNEKSLTEQQKALAAYAIILESGGTAQAAWGDIQETSAFKMQQASAEFKNAQAELGQNLLPTMTNLVGVGGAVANTIGSIPGPLQQAALAAGALALVGPKVSDAWDKVAGSLGNSRTALGSTVSDVGRLKSAGLGLLAGVVGYTATYDALERLTAVKVETDGLATAIEHLGSTGNGLDDVFGAIDDGDVNRMVEAFRLAGEGYSGLDAISAKAEQVPGVVARVLGQDYDTDIEKLDKAKQLVAAIDEQLAAPAASDPAGAKRAFDAITAALAAQGLAYDDIVTLLPLYSKAIGTSAAQEKLAADETESHTGKVKTLNEALKERIDLAEGVYSAEERKLAADQAVNDAVIAVADAQDGVTEALRNQADAAEAVEDANKAVADARAAVADAVEQEAAARRGVEQARRGEIEAAKAEQEAIADVADAERELADRRREAAGDSDAMRDALEGVTDAQERLTESQQDSIEAVKELDEVVANYSQTLQGLQDDAAGAADDVTLAEIALRKAKQAAADLGKPDKDGKRKPVTADERKEAEIRIREAERRLRELQQRAEEARADLERNQANGVEGSDAYVQASEDVADAKKAEEEAHRNLEGAVQNVADTQVAADNAVAAAEQTLREKIDAVQAAHQRRIDAHQSVVDAQRNVQKAAEGVRNAEADVAEKIAAVHKAEQDRNAAAGEVVKARQEVRDAEREVTVKLKDQATAAFELDQKLGPLTTATRNYRNALYELLQQTDPSNPRYQGLLELLYRIGAGGQPTPQQNVPPTRNPDRYSGQNRYSSGLRRRAGSGGRAESNMGGIPVTDTDPIGTYTPPDDWPLEPVRMPHPVVGPPRQPRRGFRQSIDGLIDGRNWHFGPGNVKPTPTIQVDVTGVHDPAAVVEMMGQRMDWLVGAAGGR